MEDALEKYIAERNAESDRRLLFALVRDGDLSVEKAARRMDMTEEQFKAAMQAASPALS